MSSAWFALLDGCAPRLDLIPKILRACGIIQACSQVNQKTKKRSVMRLTKKEISDFEFYQSFHEIHCTFKVTKVYTDRIVFVAPLIPGCGFTLRLDKVWTEDRIRSKGFNALVQFKKNRRRIRQAVVQYSVFFSSRHLQDLFQQYREMRLHPKSEGYELSFRLTQCA